MLGHVYFVVTGWTGSVNDAYDSLTRIFHEGTLPSPEKRLKEVGRKSGPVKSERRLVWTVKDALN